MSMATFQRRSTFARRCLPIIYIKDFEIFSLFLFDFNFFSNINKRYDKTQEAPRRIGRNRSILETWTPERGI